MSLVSDERVEELLAKEASQEAEIVRLRAALEAARPYVEHCAEGSWIAQGVLREIDALLTKDKVS